MDFTEKSAVDASDAVIDHPDGFQIGASHVRPWVSVSVLIHACLCCALPAVCDPKSLLYLFGMELDYSTQLIGGGCGSPALRCARGSGGADSDVVTRPPPWC